MPNVKIELQNGETPEEAEELLFKAISAQRTGDIHREEFHDPAMRDMVQRMQRIHDENFQLMLQEIGQALNEDYEDDGNIS